MSGNLLQCCRTYILLNTLRKKQSYPILPHLSSNIAFLNEMFIVGGQFFVEAIKIWKKFGITLKENKGVNLFGSPTGPYSGEIFHRIQTTGHEKYGIA